MPYVEKPLSELLPGVDALIASAALILPGVGDAKEALTSACLIEIENALAKTFHTHCLRAVDEVEINTGPRIDNPIFSPEDWDKELENEIGIELGAVEKRIGVPAFVAATMGVGLGAGAVTADEVADELARRVVAVWKPEPQHRGKWLASLGLAQPHIDAVGAVAAKGPPPPYQAPQAPQAPQHPPMPDKAPPLPGTPATAKPSVNDEGEAFKLFGAAVEFDIKIAAAAIGVSPGSMRNYMVGRTAPRKALGLRDARYLHADCLARIAALQRACEVFGAVTG